MRGRLNGVWVGNFRRYWPAGGAVRRQSLLLQKRNGAEVGIFL